MGGATKSCWRCVRLLCGTDAHARSNSSGGYGRGYVQRAIVWRCTTSHRLTSSVSWAVQDVYGGCAVRQAIVWRYTARQELVFVSWALQIVCLVCVHHRKQNKKK